MQGTRLKDTDTGLGLVLKPGEYIKLSTLGNSVVIWLCCSPNGLVGDISKHTIVENEDKTITVSPSILIRAYDNKEWHGYLINGIWKEC